MLNLQLKMKIKQYVGQSKHIPTEIQKVERERERMRQKVVETSKKKKALQFKVKTMREDVKKFYNKFEIINQVRYKS